MSFNHAVIWIDHQSAHVIQFNHEASESEVIKTKSTHGHSGQNSHATAGYLHAVIAAVSDAREILVVGPGSAKLELIRHAHKHDANVANKIVAVETVDHPSDAQLLAYARKYFVRVDNMKGDSLIKAA